MRVLVAFERSGMVRDAFTARGHDAWSCDLEPTDSPGNHLQEDALDVMYRPGWDLMIAHPPCQFLCSSGLHWNKVRPERAVLTEEALDVVRRCFAAPIRKKCIENPPGRIGTAIRPATQYIQPNQFGHDASKTTGLWLDELKKLRPTKFIEPRWVCCNEVLDVQVLGGAVCPNCLGANKPLPRWANQTNSGQNILGPSDDRAQLRAETYAGIADAMAAGWAP